MLLLKSVYLYEYMDDWENLMKNHCLIKFFFFSNISMEDITEADYMHAKRVCKDFKISNLAKYHDLYPKSDTLI